MDGILDIFVKPLTQPIALAVVLGAVAYVASRAAPLVAKALALLASVAVIVGAVAIAGDMGDRLSWTWLSFADDLTVELSLAPTVLGMVVVFGAGAFGLLVTLYSYRAMAGEYWEGKFYAYLTWTLAGACLVGLAGNLVVLLIGWELVTLMLFLMLNQGRTGARDGAAKAYAVLGFADACLLLAIGLLASLDGGTENLSLLRDPVAVGSLGATGYVIYALILVAALAKAGAIPLHTWIPSCAEKSPTPVLALLPAALDKLLGIYLLAVLALRMFRPDWTMQAVMMAVGAVTILAAVLMAMIQHNLKKLLSLHAVSQVGYMVLGIGTGTTIGVIGGLFHMINNAIYKGNLFLMSGTARRATGTDEIEDMGGLARVLPVTFVASIISAAAISGVPPLNGFASKWLVYQGTLEVAHHGFATTVLVVAVFGSALTLASFVKVIYSAWLSPAPRSRPRRAVKESFFLAAPMVVLAAACVLLGLFPQAVTGYVLAPGIEGAETAGAAGVVAGADGVEVGTLGLWNPTEATGLILIGMVLGLVLVAVTSWGRHIRVVRPFLAGEMPAAGDDRFRVPGTHFYETVDKLPAVGPLLRQGQAGAMDLYRWSGKHGHTLVETLRGTHTGLLSLYVAWAVVGFVVTLIYLLVTTGAG